MNIFKVFTLFLFSVVLLSTPVHSKKKNDLYSLQKSYEYHLENNVLTIARPVIILNPISIAKVEDMDGDGIPDKYDKCFASFGILALQGCPPNDLSKSITYGNPTVNLKDADFNLLVDIFSSLTFEGKNQNLNKASKTELNKLVKFLKKEKHLFLAISSYVDIDGNNHMDNYYYSEMRVDAVSQYLVKNGIASKRIKTLFFGDSMPVIALPGTRFEIEIWDKKF